MRKVDGLTDSEAASAAPPGSLNDALADVAANDASDSSECEATHLKRLMDAVDSQPARKFSKKAAEGAGARGYRQLMDGCRDKKAESGKPIAAILISIAMIGMLIYAGVAVVERLRDLAGSVAAGVAEKAKAGGGASSFTNLRPSRFTSMIANPQRPDCGFSTYLPPVTRSYLHPVNPRVHHKRDEHAQKQPRVAAVHKAAGPCEFVPTRTTSDATATDADSESL